MDHSLTCLDMTFLESPQAKFQDGWPARRILASRSLPGFLVQVSRLSFPTGGFRRNERSEWSRTGVKVWAVPRSGPFQVVPVLDGLCQVGSLSDWCHSWMWPFPRIRIKWFHCQGIPFQGVSFQGVPFQKADVIKGRSSRGMVPGEWCSKEMAFQGGAVLEGQGEAFGYLSCHPVGRVSGLV